LLRISYGLDMVALIVVNWREMSVSERAKEDCEREVVIAGRRRGEVAVCRVTVMRRENAR